MCLWKELFVFVCNGSVGNRLIKERLRNIYKTSQNLFDKTFRKLKRQNHAKSFRSLAQLADEASSNPSEIWKRLKALSEPKTKTEIFEIIREDGTISCDKKEVLTQWYTEFSECFAGLRDNIDLAFDDEFLQRLTDLKSQFDALSPEQQEGKSNFDCSNLNSEITLEEVQNAVNKS